MLAGLACLLWLHAAALMALSLAALWASCRHFRRQEAGPIAVAFTVIKPIRGADERMLENFRELLAADEEGALQVIFALETAEDPAYAVALRAAAERPGRDVLVLLTGPSGRRGGKVHNMQEALKRARHPFVVFSDADVRTTRAMLSETGRAFAGGAEAVYGIPYHERAGGLGGAWYMIGFNHYFLPPAALSLRLGVYRSFAGAWMGYSKRVLEAVGGLEAFSNRIADDYGIGSAVAGLGCRPALLRTVVKLDEAGQGAPEAFRHLSKWFVMGRWTMPAAYFAAPLFLPGLVAALAWALGAAVGTRWPGGALFAAVCAARAVSGLVQDVRLGEALMPWHGYAALAVADLGALLFWASGLRRELEWRGKRYRLRPGGLAEVIEPRPSCSA